MTNKLPVVGKRYKRDSLGCNYEVIVEQIVDNLITCSICPNTEKTFNRYYYQPYYFWQMKDFNAKMDEKYPMSKPDTKIDTKEERVEPVSIWKDVSELPEKEVRSFDCLIELYTGDIINGKYFAGDFYTMIHHPDMSLNKIRETLIQRRAITKFCELTNFINSFEQMQKDIEEFKRKFTS